MNPHPHPQPLFSHLKATMMCLITMLVCYPKDYSFLTFWMQFQKEMASGPWGNINTLYLMLLCKADNPHSKKYALESLYQLLLARGLSVREKESEVFVWNRTVNNHGGLGNNIPHDL